MNRPINLALAGLLACAAGVASAENTAAPGSQPPMPMVPGPYGGQYPQDMRQRMMEMHQQRMQMMRERRAQGGPAANAPAGVAARPEPPARPPMPARG